ncbi:hypothetical protein FQN55_004451 [Onygenales sp. PD_40]|nr:hypothetical protein FQN55_004451 [Onygenales sp. PD_40]
MPPEPVATVGSSQAAGDEEDRDVEALPSRPDHTDTRPWIVRHLGEEVNTEHADLIFLLCYFLSGLCDSSAYRAWGCFIGNTVFVGLGASDTIDQKSYHWLKALVSIISFLVGSSVYSLARHLGPHTRRALICNFASQSLLITAATCLLQSGVIEDSATITDRQTFLKLIPLSLVAFQCAGQMAASRMLAFNEIPTTVLTSLYYDLVSDPALLRPIRTNVKRNRRVSAIIGVIGGAVIGGWLAKSTGGIATALWIAAASKLAVSAIWFAWKPEKAKQPMNPVGP